MSKLRDKELHVKVKAFQAELEDAGFVSSVVVISKTLDKCIGDDTQELVSVVIGEVKGTEIPEKTVTACEMMKEDLELKIKAYNSGLSEIEEFARQHDLPTNEEFAKMNSEDRKKVIDGLLDKLLDKLLGK